MKLATAYLLLLITLLVYGYYQQQRHIENVQPKKEARFVDPRIRAREIEREKQIKLTRKFFSNYNSALAEEAKTFVDSAYIYGLDYRLLPSIAMVESTG